MVWKFQLSSMKNGKVSIFDPTQLSEMVKRQFDKFDHCVFWKTAGKGSLVFTYGDPYTVKDNKIKLKKMLVWNQYNHVRLSNLA